MDNPSRYVFFKFIKTMKKNQNFKKRRNVHFLHRKGIFM